MAAGAPKGRGSPKSKKGRENRFCRIAQKRFSLRNNEKCLPESIRELENWDLSGSFGLQQSKASGEARRNGTGFDRQTLVFRPRSGPQ